LQELQRKGKNDHKPQGEFWRKKAYNTPVSEKFKPGRKTFLYLIAGTVLAACEGIQWNEQPVWLPPVVDKYNPIFRTEAEKYPNQDAIRKLAKITAVVESGLYTQADSGVAYGLMQITLPTSQGIARRMKLGKYDIFDPETNIAMGINHLSFLYEHYKGKVEKVAWAYYAGGRNVAEKNKPYGTDAYINWIVKMYNNRDNSMSDTYLNWLQAINNTKSKCGGVGALLKCAFEEQGKNYKAYIQGVFNLPEKDKAAGVKSSGDNGQQEQLDCRVVNAPGGLPRLIHPGDRIGGKIIDSGDTAYGTWIEAGKPKEIEVCTK